MSQTIPYLGPVAIVDVETTGGSPGQNRLIEIGIIRIENGQEVSRFQSLVNPHQSVPPFVQNLTGISDRDLETAPSFEKIADEVEKQLKGALFIGHNVRFDYDFVKFELRRAGRNFSAPTFCSARFSRSLYPEHKRHNLAELIERYGLSISSHHRALDDAQAVWDFLKKMVEEVGVNKFSTFFEKLAASRPTQTRIPVEKFDNLPESSGAYVFKDAEGMALYVGKSNHLRERILGHFYGDFENSKALQLVEKATDLECYPTAGELSALFLEAELVEKLAPKHSRRPRRKVDMVCAIKHENSNGYPVISLLKESEALSLKEPPKILSYYRGFREANQALHMMVDSFRLCRKLLGLEKSEGACSALNVKKCSGACVGSESKDSYSGRLARAFQKEGLSSWPHSSAVLVDEYDVALDRGESYVVRDWRILARVFYQGESRRVEKIASGFDWDQFKVLKRVMQNEDVRIRAIDSVELQTFISEAAAIS